MTSLLAPELERLSAAEKIDLIGLLWDSIPEAEIPVPEWHRKIIAERLEEMRRNPEEGMTIEEYLAAEGRSS